MAGYIPSMARIKKALSQVWNRYLDAWWRRHVVDDFDRHYPNEPWLF
jgi:hypothetical protein